MHNTNSLKLLLLILSAFGLPRLHGMESPACAAQNDVQTPDQRLEQAALHLNQDRVTQLLMRGARPQQAMTALQRMVDARQLSPEDMQKCKEIYAQLERSFTLALVIERENTLVNARRQETPRLATKL